MNGAILESIYPGFSGDGMNHTRWLPVNEINLEGYLDFHNNGGWNSVVDLREVREIDSKIPDYQSWWNEFGKDGAAEDESSGASDDAGAMSSWMKAAEVSQTGADSGSPSSDADSLHDGLPLGEVPGVLHDVPEFPFEYSSLREHISALTEFDARGGDDSQAEGVPGGGTSSNQEQPEDSGTTADASADGDAPWWAPASASSEGESGHGDPDAPESGMATQYIVDSNAELQQALEAAASGDEIRLVDAGEAYDIHIRGSLAESAVGIRITSDDPNDPAVISTIRLDGASGISFDHVVIDSSSVADTRAGWLEDINISNSTAISITDSVLRADAAGPHLPQGGAEAAESLGLVRNTDGFIFANNVVSGYNFGLATLESSNIEILSNDISRLQGDAIRMGGVVDVLIEDNNIHDIYGSDSSLNHMDMIQLWSTNTDQVSANITIRGNVLDAGGGAGTQSIFMRNEQVDHSGDADRFYQNITITDNVIYNGHKHGITVGQTDGLAISNNTLITNAQAGMIVDGGAGERLSAPTIRVADGSLDVSILDNVTAAISAPAGATLDGNLIVDYADSSLPTYYANLFINLGAGGDVSLTGLQALPGGLLDGGEAGAARTQFDPTPDALTAAFTTSAVNGSETLFRFDAGYTADSNGYLDANDATFIWQFEDGTAQIGQVVEHEFDELGPKTVRLVVSTPDGQSDEMHAAVSVSDPVLFDIYVGAGVVDDHSSYDSALEFDASRATDDGIWISQGETLQVDNANEQIFNLDQFTLAFDMRSFEANHAGSLVGIHKSFGLSVTEDGEMRFDLPTAEGESHVLVSDGANLLDTDWHRIAVSFDGIGGELALFVDGAEVGDMAVTGSTQAREYWGMTFGNEWNASFTGLMDNMELIAEPLSATEAAQDFDTFLQQHSIPGSDDSQDDGSQSDGSPSRLSLDINAEDLSSYGYERQDNGVAIPDPDGHGITLSGNAWKVFDMPLDISADTVFEFNFDYADDGEIVGIGFIQDGVILEENAFQLTGSQIWGVQDTRLTDLAPGETAEVSINVGQHISGQFDGIAFIADDDAAGSTIASFSDMYLVE